MPLDLCSVARHAYNTHTLDCCPVTPFIRLPLKALASLTLRRGVDVS